MRMALHENTLIIADANDTQLLAIKSWNLTRLDKGTGTLSGAATLELLDKLSTIVHLPPAIAACRDRLRAVHDAVERERVNESPKPMYAYPVKVPLYAHQVRGANMCLLTFGWVRPTGQNRP